MFALYITHPQVLVDPATPVPEWSLSRLGRERAEAAAALSWIGRLKRIVSSNERKAIETAEILAPAGIAVEIANAMGENDRSATGFLAPDQFEAAADWFFAHPDDSFHGWETARDAQARIVAAVDQALLSHDPVAPIAFVGHGGVGTLLKCHLGRRRISRDEDQGPGGGGNLFAFSLGDRALLGDWTPFDLWSGLSGSG